MNAAEKKAVVKVTAILVGTIAINVVARVAIHKTFTKLASSAE